MDVKDALNYLGLVMVGVLWGATNPFMEKGSSSNKDGKENDSNKKDDEKEYKKIDFGWRSFLQTILNLRFLVPFIINQAGSGLYYYLLGQTKITIGPLVANSINCIVTYLTENTLKRKPVKLGTLLGVGLIILGICICLLEEKKN